MKTLKGAWEAVSRTGAGVLIGDYVNFVELLRDGPLNCC